MFVVPGRLSSFADYILFANSSKTKSHSLGYKRVLFNKYVAYY